MQASIGGKLGNWYEEQYVLVQYLRLLLGDVGSVQWENWNGEEGEGIDCFVEEGDCRVAVQCKRAEERNWTLSSIGGQRTRRGKTPLAHARDWLERAGGPGRKAYRFVSNRAFPKLERATERARAVSSTEVWGESVEARAALLKAFGFETGAADSVAKCWDLCRRMEIRTINEGSLEELAETLLLRLVAHDRTARLRDGVRRAMRDLVGREVRYDELSERLSRAGVTVRPSPGSAGFRARLDGLRNDFRARAELPVGRSSIRHIERDEVRRIVEACREAPRGTTVLVHGPGGSGKSVAIASALDRFADDLPALPVGADPAADGSSESTDDLVVGFAGWCGDHKGVLVLDQLDRIRSAGTSAQSAFVTITRTIRRAQRLGLVILVGCRTVDALHHTQLRRLLGDRDVHASIAMEDLPEPALVDALALAGIAIDDVPRRLRQLIRRPLLLAIYLSLVATGNSAVQARGPLQLVRAWWKVEREPWGEQADRVLDSLYSNLEKTGTLDCVPEFLDRPLVVQALVGSGVLHRDPASQRIAPAHQLLTDAYIAGQWGAATTAGELHERIGERLVQTWAQARRLRLAVALLVEGPHGPPLLDALWRSERLRPMLKRAMLMGLGDLAAPGDEVVRLVRGWLGEPAQRSTVISWLLQGNAAWFLAMRDWLQRTWSDEPNLQELILRVVGSVADQAGDEVAELLTCWAGQDRGVLDRARGVFWRDAGSDSDALFEKRLEFLATSPTQPWPLDLDRLGQDHPERALRLLAATVRRASREELLRGDPMHFWSLWKTDEIPDAVRAIGIGPWEREFAPWWRGLDIEEAWAVEVGDGEHRSPAPLAKLVSLFAAIFARALSRGEIGWEDLVALLPPSGRMLDAWLLLATGSALREGPGARDAADAAIAWLESCPDRLHLDVGFRCGSYDLTIAKNFLTAVSRTASDDGFRRLERVVVEFRDQWTVEDEAARRDGRGGLSLRNRRGLTAYRLLPALAEERRSENATRVLEQLRRKFESREDCAGESPPRARWVESAIRDEAARAWSGVVWADKLREAASLQEPPQWVPDGDRYRVFDLRTLSRQLERLARCEPARFLEIARGFDPSVPAEGRVAILRGAGTLSPSPPGPDRDDEAPASEAAVVELVSRPAYRDEPACARVVASIVEERPHCEWPEGVLDRLIAIASGESFAGLALDEVRLEEYRLNDDACVALAALAGLAGSHRGLRSRLLAVARTLAEHDDPGRRAAAAVLAMRCRSVDAHRAVGVLLDAAAHGRVAADRDVMQRLFDVACNETFDAAQRVSARDILIRLLYQDEERLLVAGGEAVAALRHQGVVDHGMFDAVWESSPRARTAISRALVHYLRDPRADWAREIALRACAETETGKQVLACFLASPVDHLLEDARFMQGVLRSPAVRDWPQPVLEACDRRNELRQVADLVLEMAAASRFPGDASEHPGRWRADVAALVSRLAEEAETRRDFALLERSLDALDALLEADSARAGLVVAQRI